MIKWADKDPTRDGQILPKGKYNLKWHLMKCPMASAFWQGWGMPFDTSMGGLGCLWDWWGRHKGCCTASVQSRSPLASCSCCLALMAGGFHGSACGMSLAPSCCWSVSLLAFPKANPPCLCCWLRLCHTWWATLLVCLSHPWSLRAAGHQRLLQGNTGKFSGLSSFTLWWQARRGFLKVLYKILPREG